MVAMPGLNVLLSLSAAVRSVNTWRRGGDNDAVDLGSARLPAHLAEELRGDAIAAKSL